MTPALPGVCRDLGAVVLRLGGGTARQAATVIVGAAAPFAVTAYARARLLRQAHASGMLTDELDGGAPH